ncbi:hypothetical protein Nepgr_019446 [Nepenthes gracilis]|uniref:Mechanosensitive ion channel MscS domain-containing protein n=1 Tax=Nepenthes gracilis TaxID=150966 RepID=A0AAD3SV57_NEPGR|nr:hypothetical protein Nepgr_019446 [Nepenthes gracilis]
MTWTLVSLLISALLWLLKTVLLLKWEAHAVYKRFRDRILRAGFQLYFLALISGTYWSIFRPGENRDVDDKVEKAGEEKSMKASGEKDNTTVRAATNDKNNNSTEDGRKEKGKEEEKRTDKDITQDDQKDKKEKEETRKAKDEEDKRKARDIPQDGKKEKEEEEKKKAKDILNIDGRMHSKNVTTYGIEQMARHFVALAKLSSKKDDDISDLLAECRKAVSRAIKRDDLEYEIDKNSHITEDNLHDAFPLDDDEVKLVFSALKEMHASEKVSYATLEQWMVRAHKHCLALGYTLTDAKKVVDCLNKLMIGFLITAVILSWLLLTEIATTKLLVVIASPILAATFIFGDTCKTLFEGIIFAFVKHPFDVGDLCIIDNIEMEVKRMGILTTSFLKMGTKDQALYPNSILATKSIVNLKETDPTDFVELSLDRPWRRRRLLF